MLKADRSERCATSRAFSNCFAKEMVQVWLNLHSHTLATHFPSVPHCDELEQTKKRNKNMRIFWAVFLGFCYCIVFCIRLCSQLGFC